MLCSIGVVVGDGVVVGKSMINGIMVTSPPSPIVGEVVVLALVVVVVVKGEVSG